MRQDYHMLLSDVLDYLTLRDEPAHGFAKSLSSGQFEYDLPKWLERYNKEIFIKDFIASGFVGRLDNGGGIENIPLNNLLQFLRYCVRNSTILFPYDVEENEKHNKQVEERLKNEQI